MRREWALRVVLVVVGLLFIAGVVPLTIFFSREPAVPMIMSIYVTLGIFLLLAVRDPAANRSLYRLRRMGKSCACWGNGCAGVPECDRAPRTRGSGCVRDHRHSAGRAGSCKTISRESLCCGRVGGSRKYGSFGFWENFVGQCACIERKDAVVIGESCVGRSIHGVFFYGLLEIISRLGQVFGFATVPIISTSQIGILRFWIDGMMRFCSRASSSPVSLIRIWSATDRATWLCRLRTSGRSDS